MKVLHITNSIDKSTGGPSYSVPTTCIELANHGIFINLITQESTNMADVKESTYLSVHFKSIWELFIYGSRLSNKEIDLIHLQHIWNPYIQVMAFWAYRKKIPYIITPRGMLEPWIINRNHWKKKIALFFYQRKAIQRATYIHATAEMEAQNIKALGFKNPISIIPNGIDLSGLNLKKLNFGNKKIVFLSRIHPKKGIEVLLEAWRNCNTGDWILEIAGNGDEFYIESLKQNAKNLKNVHFVGTKYDQEKWDFLRSADVLVLPTYSENFGMVVAEALAVGVPVITTKGTPWEDLEKFNCGWWIDLSVVNLQNILIKILNISPSILFEMGENGKKLISEKYDIKTVSNHIIDLYKKALN
ncbi:glycosyltransferase [Flavobacterium agrisoli]|uniref:Glycosyltransferase n=1 Tax=Flavobacterium agrisoli TaxID=2793066 RepID=A0A934PJL1_9FLAO|nr:glycosyltransferase [Flavobacterium agrisoli]MBK0368797.1 glycosyltransferase [Flavobacterium agrisoli]